MFSDPIIQQVLKNTLFYVTAGVAFAVIGGLLLAILMNQGLRNIGFFRFPFLATIALPMVSVASIWLFLYSPRVGLFNEILGGLGLPLSNWLNGRELALPALFAVYLWKQLGYFALFYLAALQALPVDVLEAAKLDGITSVATVALYYLAASFANNLLCVNDSCAWRAATDRSCFCLDDRWTQQCHQYVPLLCLRTGLQIFQYRHRIRYDCNLAGRAHDNGDFAVRLS